MHTNLAIELDDNSDLIQRPKTKPQITSADLRFQDCGSIVLIHALSDLGGFWIDSNVRLSDDLLLWGGGVPCERKYAFDIFNGAQMDGLACDWS